MLPPTLFLAKKFTTMTAMINDLEAEIYPFCCNHDLYCNPSFSIHYAIHNAPQKVSLQAYENVMQEGSSIHPSFSNLAQLPQVAKKNVGMPLDIVWWA